MKELFPYCHGFKFDQSIRLSTDNIFGIVQEGTYIPITPPGENDFLLLDGTNFLLLDGTHFLLL